MKGYQYQQEYADIYEFEDLVRQTRKHLLSMHTHTPVLFYIHIEQQDYPCYIDFLCDGIEVLVFPDDTAFCQSILHSANEEPDFLFTNALVLTFLYHPLPDDPDIYAIDECNRCLLYESGYVPQVPLPAHIKFLKQIVSCLLTYLQEHKEFLYDSTNILQLHSDGSYSYIEKEMQETSISMIAPDDELTLLQRLSHTNEHLSLYLLAYSNPEAGTSKRLDIHLSACADTYQEEISLVMHPQTQMVQQVYDFLFDVFSQHGIPAAVHFQNINLANMTLPFLSQLDVPEKEKENNPLLDLFLSTIGNLSTIQS